MVALDKKSGDHHEGVYEMSWQSRWWTDQMTNITIPGTPVSIAKNNPGFQDFTVLLVGLNPWYTPIHC